MTTTVSVVIITVGRPELARAVLSATAQTLRPLEVIVVNDGVGVDVQDFLRGLALPEVPIRHLETGGRGGDAARNAGIDAAQGELVALLDDDDIWFPHKLAEQVARLSGRTDRVITVCRNIDERTGRVAPADTYADGPVEEWLFNFSMTAPTSRRTSAEQRNADAHRAGARDPFRRGAVGAPGLGLRPAGRPRRRADRSPARAAVLVLRVGHRQMSEHGRLAEEQAWAAGATCAPDRNNFPTTT